jgi:PTH2 family peptidyl-tRNA hydrolase
MKPVQYIVANKGLKMSPGKLAAQVAHAAVNAAFKTSSNDLAPWFASGHTKVVLEARDTEHLLMVERFVKERGIETVLVIDEGRTEIAPHSPTALATVVVDKDDPNVQHAFADLRTYREDKPKIEDRPVFGTRIRAALDSVR